MYKISNKNYKLHIITRFIFTLSSYFFYLSSLVPRPPPPPPPTIWSLYRSFKIEIENCHSKHWRRLQPTWTKQTEVNKQICRLIENVIENVIEHRLLVSLSTKKFDGKPKLNRYAKLFKNQITSYFATATYYDYRYQKNLLQRSHKTSHRLL